MSNTTRFKSVLFAVVSIVFGLLVFPTVLETAHVAGLYMPVPLFVTMFILLIASMSVVSLLIAYYVLDIPIGGDWNLTEKASSSIAPTFLVLMICLFFSEKGLSVIQVAFSTVFIFLCTFLGTICGEKLLIKFKVAY